MENIEKLIAERQMVMIKRIPEGPTHSPPGIEQNLPIEQTLLFFERFSVGGRCFSNMILEYPVKMTRIGEAREIRDLSQ